MCAAARHLGQLLPPAEGSVKGIALGLGALILPVGGPFVRQGGGQLADEGPGGVKAGQAGLGAGVPEDAAVLLAGTPHGADAGDDVGRRRGGSQAGQDQVEGLEPHGNRGHDLARGVAHVDTLADAILAAEVVVEFDFCLGDRLEVRVDNDGCIRGQGGSADRGYACE